MIDLGPCSTPQAEAKPLPPHERIFTDSYWYPDNDEPGELADWASHNLSVKLLKVAASVFAQGVHQALHTKEGSFSLHEGEHLNPNSLLPGTLLLIDQERITPRAIYDADYIRPDLDYPTQAASFINGCPEQLIGAFSDRNKFDGVSPAYKPGKFAIIKKQPRGAGETNEWTYMREAWYSLVLPAKNGNGLITFPSLKRDKDEQPSHQDSISVSSSLPQNTKVGLTSWIDHRTGSYSWMDPRGLRIKSVDIFPATSEIWQREVTAQKTSKRRLGRLSLKSN
jgi:hypothetical protein